MSAEEQTWDEQYVTDELGVSSRTVGAVLDAFDSADDLLDAYRSGVNLTDYDGIGNATATAIRHWIEDAHPGARTERLQNDPGVCMTFVADPDIDGLPDHDEFTWGFECGQCGTVNPLKGDPRGFSGRPFRCEVCGWVSLLHGPSVNGFRNRHYPDDGGNQGDQA